MNPLRHVYPWNTCPHLLCRFRRRRSQRTGIPYSWVHRTRGNPVDPRDVEHPSLKANA